MLSPDAPLEVFATIDSTILEARRRAEAGDDGPVWMIAHEQTAGRGRRGRAWTTIHGNLMATYLGATSAPLATIALLGFAAGVAIAETLDDMAGAPVAALKWPNDVMLRGAKAAGILVDSGAAARGGNWFALGFGVNLAGAPQDAGQPAAALADVLGRAPPAPETVFAALRPRMEAHAQGLALRGFEPLRAAWMARAFGMGAKVTALAGQERIEGVARGLSPDGALELETAAGLRLIGAGDVYFPAMES
ncbi:MAG: biotin--[acetyl-CoA-carboxylase] ligase [Alphaproteobacteria bacterium]|nr:biotin--[acetyl-CoA-carboxylase] ligase [Alphaproteobacteria bacterium]